jgi:Pyruvate/2-oxoacid:ferredoxin oxidoreductase delta subunit
MKEKRPYADLSKCIHCFCCEELCPEKAIRVKRSGIGNFLMNQCAEPLVSLVSSVRALFGDK